MHPTLDRSFLCCAANCQNFTSIKQGIILAINVPVPWNYPVWVKLTIPATCNCGIAVLCPICGANADPVRVIEFTETETVHYHYFETVVNTEGHLITSLISF